MCSIMVASAMGTMMMMALTSLPPSQPLNRLNTVFSSCTGKPIHLAAATPEKSTWPNTAATR